MVRWLGAAALGFVAAGGCATLPDIDSDVCGNGVVESHEDCDTFPPAGAKAITCGQPGTKTACLMHASQASDCPSGFVFGPVDQVCRKPTNGFHAGPDFNDITGRGATVADFDGDGIGDLTLTPADEATREIDYMAGDAVRSKLTLSANALLVDSVGSIDGDARADLVVPTVSGITALHGAENGGFEPQIFSVFEDPPLRVFDSPDAFIGEGDGGRVSAGIGRRDPSSCHDDASCRLFVCFSACAPDTRTDLALVDTNHGAFDPSSVTAVFADVDGTGQSLFVTIDGGASVVVIPATWKALVGAVPPFELELPATKFRVHDGSLEGTVATKTHGGVFIVDLDGDGERDVVVSAGGDGNAAPSTLFYKKGPTASWLDLQLAPLYPFDNPNLESAPLLGVGHFDTAPEAGYVTPVGVFEHGLLGYGSTAAPLNLFDWTSAAVADFNADGFDDVAAVSSEPGVDLFLGGTSTVSSAHLSSETGLRNVISGDFDGDGSIDIVATAVSPASCDRKQAIVGYYGKALGLPEGPFELGAAPRITSIARARSSGDSIDDLFIEFSKATESGDCDKTTLSATALIGTSDRRMLSPFFLSLDVPSHTYVGNFAVPTRTTLADLDGNGPSDIVTTAIAQQIMPTDDAGLHLLLLGLTTQPSGDLVGTTAVDLGLHSEVVFLATPEAGWPTPGAEHPSVLVFAPDAAADQVSVVARATRVEVDGTVSEVDFGADDAIVGAVDDASVLLATKVVATDVDHDGAQDFVAMVEIPAEAQTASDGQQGVTQKACFVLRADPSAPAGLRAKRLSLPDDQPVVDLALSHDVAGVEHLLVATGSGLYLVDGDTVRLLHEEAVEAGHKPRIQSVATGDITGDGLEDIVLVLATKTILLSRMAANEKGDPEFSLEL